MAEELCAGRDCDKVRFLKLYWLKALSNLFASSQVLAVLARVVRSGILLVMYSGILSGTSSDVLLTAILAFYQAFYLPNVVCSGIIYGTSSDIHSGILSGNTGHIFWHRSMRAFGVTSFLALYLAYCLAFSMVQLCACPDRAAGLYGVQVRFCPD